VLADVAQPRGTQQRIADGVQQHVGIAVAEQALLVGNLHPADDELAACNELVDVESLADAHR
jgi:hypothetical protein